MANVSRPPFSPQNHVITVAGITVTGYAGGSYLDINPNADIASVESGSDGEIHTTMTANNTATASIRMYYDNPSYQLLRAAAILFQTTGLYVPFASVNISNPADTTASANSHFIRHSQDVYSNSTADMVRTYQIFLHNVIRA
jgi:hypothetical protein